MSTGTGTQADPIIAMSADPAQIRRDIRASLAHFNRTDDAYWFAKETHPEAPFSNGLWYVGHNRYWETAMHPDDTGSRNPADGGRPALYLAVSIDVPPPVVVPPVNPPPLENVLALVVGHLAAIDTRLTALEAHALALGKLVMELEQKPFPIYTGTINLLGVRTITLTPKP